MKHILPEIFNNAFLVNYIHYVLYVINIIKSIDVTFYFKFFNFIFNVWIALLKCNTFPECNLQEKYLLLKVSFFLLF